MEILDLYDENHEKTDKTMLRGERVPDGFYRIVVHVCIFDRGRMLIQQRSESKKSFTGLWDFSSGGACKSGETSKEAAKRETLEELGLDYPLKRFRHVLSTDFGYGFDEVYIINDSFHITELTLQSEEVQGARWADKREVLELILSNQFVPYKKSYIDFIFSMRNNYGIYRG